MSSATPAGSQAIPGQGSGSVPPAPMQFDLSHLAGVQVSGMDRDQILALLQSLPGNVLSNKAGTDNPQEAAAQILTSLAAAGHTPLGYGGPNQPIADPGPSSHPRGPPNLGQPHSAVVPSPTPGPVLPSAPNLPNQSMSAPGESEESPEPEGTPAPTSSGGGRRSRSGAAMGSDEWTRQRKDNHKEVERRRRGNINEGINELGRIVPHGSGEKAKGAILSRAVQYIHHLKENESRNIEKWTLEKLLMDQAMGDLQSQLEDVRRAWDTERNARERLEEELNSLRERLGVAAVPVASSNPPVVATSSPQTGQKRGSPEGNEQGEEAKKQRTE